MILNQLNNLELIIQTLKIKNKGRIIALDVGSKRIGVASCDHDRLVVTAKLIIDRKSNLIDFKKIQQILIETKAEIIVIGYPLDQDGKLNQMTNFVEKFASNLDCFLDQSITIILSDERYSSFSARMINYEHSRKNKSKKFYDDISAVLILEQFLNQITVNN